MFATCKCRMKCGTIKFYKEIFKDKQKIKIKTFEIYLILRVFISFLQVLLLPKPSETNNFFIHRLFLILYLISFFLERKVGRCFD